MVVEQITEEAEASAFIREARQARLHSQRKRQLAAERAVRLELQLREAAEAGMRAEIARKMEAQRRLAAVQKVTAEMQRLTAESQAEASAETSFDTLAAQQAAPPKSAAWRRRAAIAGLLGTVTLAILLTPLAAKLADPLEHEGRTAVLDTAPGDRRVLSLSYALRQPPAR
jgi:hypothetical protein